MDSSKNILKFSFRASSIVLIQISRVSNCIVVTCVYIWKRILWTVVNDLPDLLFNYLTEGRFTP